MSRQHHGLTGCSQGISAKRMHGSHSRHKSTRVWSIPSQASLSLRRNVTALIAFFVMLHFLHRHDPQPEIYELYTQVIPRLGSSDNVASSLRGFELELLGLLGYAVSLDQEAGTHQDVEPGRNYEYRIEQGPVPVDRSEGPLVFDGATLLAIGAGQFDDAAVLRAANRLLREVIAHHLGGKELRSRKVLLEVHRGRIAPTDSRNASNE